MGKARKRSLIGKGPVVLDSFPRHLERKHIYVIPSGFGAGFLLVVFGAIVTAINYNNNAALAFSGLMLGMFAVTLIQGYRALSAIEILGAGAEGDFVGGRPRLILVIRNTARTPIGLNLSTSKGQAPLNIAALPGMPQKVELPLVATRRGCFPAPVLRMRTLHPFGMGLVWSNLLPEVVWHAYPEPLPDGEPLPGGRRGGTRARVSPDGTDVHHLRPYRKGDALRDIAWKASARSEGLLSRSYEQPAGGECVIDWNILGHLPLEKRLAQIVAWVQEAEARGWSSEVALPGRTIGPGRGAGHCRTVFECLAEWPGGDA